MKKLFSLFAALLFVGSMMAADPVASLTPTDGGSYVVAVYQSSKYYALPNTITNGGTIAGDEVTLNAVGKVNTADAAGKTWTLEEGTTTGQFYFTFEKENNTYYLYKNGTSTSNKNFKVSTSNMNYWTFTANGTGYTVTSVDRGTNKTKIYCNSGTFECSGSASAIILLPIGNVPTNPSITTDPTSLDFGTVEQGATVAAKTFALTGLNLTDANDVTVTAPTGFKVSVGDDEPATSITLNSTSKSLSATIKVTPVTSTVANFSDNISISTDDLDDPVTVSLTMSVVAVVPVTGVTLNKTTLSLYDGDTFTLTATIAPNDATNKNVTWESDATGVATVDENGLVTAKATGTATITCKSAADPTKSATCEVTVIGPDVTLDFTDNSDWQIPVGTTKITGTNTYTAGGYTITLYGPSGNGYYYDDTKNNVMLGKLGAYLGLPNFTSKAIAKVVTEAVSGGAAAVTFNVFQGETEVSTEATDCSQEHSFTISPKKANTEHIIKVTNANNVRFSKIKIYLGEPDPIYTVKWSLGAGADESLGELEKMGASDSYTKYFDKDILTIGTYTVKVFKDDATEPITTKELEVGTEVGKYHIEFDYDASQNKLEASATRTGTTTSVDNTELSNKAVKFIQNGQLFIELNGHIYNVQGQVVK